MEVRLDVLTYLFGEWMENSASIDGIGPLRCTLFMMALCSTSHPSPNNDDGFGHLDGISPPSIETVS